LTHVLQEVGGYGRNEALAPKIVERLNYHKDEGVEISISP